MSAMFVYSPLFMLFSEQNYRTAFSQKETRQASLKNKLINQNISCDRDGRPDKAGEQHGTVCVEYFSILYKPTGVYTFTSDPSAGVPPVARTLSNGQTVPYHRQVLFRKKKKKISDFFFY